MHSKEIVHRDLKPEYTFFFKKVLFQWYEIIVDLNWNRNIFVDDDKLVIADFGLSKKKFDIKTQTKCSGTFPYMSPECFGEEKITPSSDIWYIKIYILIYYIILMSIFWTFEKKNLYWKGRLDAFFLS